mgnify:CR=1 FL=1
MAFKNIFQLVVVRLLCESKGANDDRRSPGAGVAKVEGATKSKFGKLAGRPAYHVLAAAV